MKTAIRKMGNSHGVIIPKPLLAEIGAKVNDHVDMKVEAGRLVIAPVGHDPRAGWAEECKALRQAGEDGLVWPEFGNEADKNLVGDEARRSLVGRARSDDRQRNSEDATLPDCLPGCDGQRAADGSCSAAHKQGRATSFRPPVSFKGTAGLILLDQLRAVDRTRLRSRMGKVGDETLVHVLTMLRWIFAE